MDENLCIKHSSLKPTEIEGDEENCRGSCYFCYQNVLHCSEPAIDPLSDQRKYRNINSFDHNPYENITMYAGKCSMIYKVKFTPLFIYFYKNAQCDVFI